MSAENVMKMMSEGPVFSPDEADAKLDFAGQTWCIKSLVGDKNSSVLLLLGPGHPETDEVNPAKVVDRYLTAGAALLVGLVDGNLTKEVRQAAHTLLVDALDEAERRWALNAAGRGKPS